MGFRDGRFVSLSERDKRDVLKLMARVVVQSYRRGAQQGAGLAQRPSFRAELGEWRYGPSLDLSPWVDGPRMTTSLERLDGECGEALRRIGLFLKDTSARGPRPWPLTWRRLLWAGYTREQRCSIQAQISHKVA